MTHLLDVKCPKCGAPAGRRCRAVTTGRNTDTHGARSLAAEREFERRVQAGEL